VPGRPQLSFMVLVGQTIAFCRLSFPEGRPRKTMVRPTENHLQTNCGKAASCHFLLPDYAH
jgi:hypothetical protein